MMIVSDLFSDFSLLSNNTQSEMTQRIRQNQKEDKKRGDPALKKEKSSLKSLLKKIQEELKASESKNIRGLLLQFFESGEMKIDDYLLKNISMMVEQLADQKIRYKKCVNLFVYVLRLLQIFSKGQSPLFKESNFYKHLEQLKTLLGRVQIYQWGSDIKLALSRDSKVHSTNINKTLSQLSMDNKLQAKAKFRQINPMLPNDLLQERGEALDKDKSTLQKLREIDIKINMFALKFNLVAESSVGKLIELDEKIRATINELQKQLYCKEEELQIKFKARQRELQEQVQRMNKQLQKYQQKGQKYSSSSNPSAKRPLVSQPIAPQTDFKNKEQPEHLPLSPAQDKDTFQFYQSEIIKINEKQSKQFLKHKIVQLAKVTPKSTVRLFSSKLNQQYSNFHEFFDKKANILVLVKLKNRTVIGGYSREEFQANCIGNYGFIFSLTRKQAFQKIKGSSISYDPQAIIFGKNQLKIKNKSLNLYSNFGSYERNFHSYGKDIDYFIGNEDLRYVEIEVFEIWQVGIQ